ncbi:hypothetical protein VFPFJ_03075 [Purpureocillium lilacinum]|uniref:Uncharacterized protein n=1 Tax=Purpureocillium lilacinum TaxID=33203 RepID=A0A179HLP5_PURLI|nr:hypothetical protein VFPFJ_03075 [Purpureocillium lilacinum]OAQ91335.1 hypothetical protein VFPFJ_03075 [Purpureocillium lilacinum]
MYGRSSCSGNRSSSSGGVVVTTSRTITSHTQTAPTVRGDLSAPRLLPNFSSGAPVQQLRLFGSPPIPRFHSGAPPPPPPPREGGCSATTTYASPATQLASQPAPGREELGPPPRILLPPRPPRWARCACEWLALSVESTPRGANPPAGLTVCQSRCCRAGPSECAALAVAPPPPPPSPAAQESRAPSAASHGRSHRPPAMPTLGRHAPRRNRKRPSQPSTTVPTGRAHFCPPPLRVSPICPPDTSLPPPPGGAGAGVATTITTTTISSSTALTTTGSSGRARGVAKRAPSLALAPPAPATPAQQLLATQAKAPPHVRFRFRSGQVSHTCRRRRLCASAPALARLSYSFPTCCCAVPYHQRQRVSPTADPTAREHAAVRLVVALHLLPGGLFAPAVYPWAVGVSLPAKHAHVPSVVRPPFALSTRARKERERQRSAASKLRSVS